MTNYEALIESRSISARNLDGTPNEIKITRERLRNGEESPITGVIRGGNYKRETLVTVTSDILTGYGVDQNPSRTLGISTKRGEGRADLSKTETLVVYDASKEIKEIEIVDLSSSPVKEKQARKLRTHQPKNKSKKRPDGNGIIPDSLYPY